jgi:mono/diheme cytochrome c family protein
MPRPWYYALAPLFLIGCGNDLGYGAAPGAGGDDDTGGSDTPVAHGGLPCDVEAVFSDHCQTCHGATPSSGAPMSLVSYGDLVAKNPAGTMVVERALARMRSASSQMPPLPAPAVTAAEIADVQAWLDAGTPSGDCVAAPGPFDGPLVCTSGRMWTAGNSESPLMHPGNACIACHATAGDDDATRRHGAPQFTIGGTVYPTGHEPNDCNGAASATVEVTDANNTIISLPTNAAGNFFTTQALAQPIHVAVVAGGKRRAMAMSPPVGDCNSCHTPTGASGAPGRIALP